MQVVSIISTKGGVGKTTTAANLGGFIADAGLRVLLLDLDVQPTLSSYFTLDVRAPGGIYEMLAFNERRIEQLVSRTAIAGLDLVLSNDDRGCCTLRMGACDCAICFPSSARTMTCCWSTPRARAACCWRWRCWRPTWRCRR